VVSATILTLDQLGVAYGFTFGLALTVVSAICTGIFLLVLDRGRTLDGASVGARARFMEGREAKEKAALTSGD